MDRPLGSRREPSRRVAQVGRYLVYHPLHRGGPSLTPLSFGEGWRIERCASWGFLTSGWKRSWDLRTPLPRESRSSWVTYGSLVHRRSVKTRVSIARPGVILLLQHIKVVTYLCSHWCLSGRDVSACSTESVEIIWHKHTETFIHTHTWTGAPRSVSVLGVKCHDNPHSVIVVSRDRTPGPYSSGRVSGTPYSRPTKKE